MISEELERRLLAELDSDDATRRQALAELFERTHAPLHRVALKLTGNASTADDAVQETFAAVMRSIDRFRGEARLSTWLYRIAVREALRSARKGPVHEELDEAIRDTAPSPGRSPDGQVADRDGAQALLQAICELPPRLRVVIALAGLQGQPQAQVAEVLGIPVGTVHSRLNTARELLRRRLGLSNPPGAGPEPAP